ncbi:hypothetical protein QL285_068367 [Trifolium repens]|nr:hypothetical protein QL285_068367 [Trifolium repens]
MRIWFPRKEPLPRNTLDFIQNFLKIDGFIGENFIVPNTPKDPNNRMPYQPKPFERLLSTLKRRQKTLKKESKNYPEESPPHQTTYTPQSK